MRLVLRSIAVLGLLCATSTAAVADGIYVMESLGGTDVRDDLASSMSSAVRFRVAGGYRYENWAFEGWVAGTLNTGSGFHGSSPNPSPPTKCGPERCADPPADDRIPDSSEMFSYGVDVKYLRPVTRHVELYLRGGLSRGLVDNGYAGRGLGLGAGVQLKGKVPALGFLFWPFFFTDLGPKVTAALFIDNGYEFYRLHKGGIEGNGSIDAQLHHLTFGFAVGSDF